MSHAETWIVARGGARLTVAALGGMVEAALRLADGRVVRPLFRPPWADTGEGPTEPPLLGALRGEFLCAPFGYARPQAALAPRWRSAASPGHGWPHGYGANHRWRLAARDAASISIEIDYPADQPIERLTRHLTVAPEGDGFTARSVIEARHACAVPVALHACFALPLRIGAVRLHPGAFRRGYTHPTEVEPGASRAAVDARFADLAAVPATAGGTIALDALPLEDDTEEVVLLAGSDGSFTVLDSVARTRTVLTWDAGQLPHCQVWISNRGRRAPPWDGRTLCVGIEPCRAAMDLGAGVSAGDNPMRADGFSTVVAIAPGIPWECSYHLTVVST